MLSLSAPPSLSLLFKQRACRSRVTNSIIAQLISRFLPFLVATGKALMAPYLPRDGHSGSPYSEGGALYALGLITANHGAAMQPFLRESLLASSNPIIQHGACLGLGEYAVFA